MRLPILAVAAAGFVTSASAQKVKVMPLGDSITEITCWRALVWDMLVDAGLSDQVDFVGSRSTNPQECTAASGGSFDLDHEGHSGWQAVNIANQWIDTWMNASRPDITMFMLGSNDVNMGRATAQIMAAYDTILASMRVVNPRMRVIVDTVVPSPFNMNPIIDLNAEIPGWAAENDAAASPIEVADCSGDNGFTARMLRDGVHPNELGDELIANQVGPLLIQFVKDVIAERDVLNLADEEEGVEEVEDSVDDVEAEEAGEEVVEEETVGDEDQIEVPEEDGIAVGELSA